MPFSVVQREVLLGVSRSAIRGKLTGEEHPPPSIESVDPALHRPAGCFVSLHRLRSKRLRGCVGCLEARRALIQAVHESSLGVLSDPRFVHDPVRLEELPELDLELTVLSPLLEAQSCLDFDPLLNGILLIIGERSGCFLPQVARDTGWGREQLLDRLCTEKMGLSAPSWKRPEARLFTFTAEIIGPEPFVSQPGGDPNQMM